MDLGDTDWTGEHAHAMGKKLIEPVGVLKPVPTTEFTQRLHNKARKSQRAAEFRSHDTLDECPLWPPDDPSPSSVLAQFSVPDTLGRLAHASVAQAIRETDSRFKELVDSVRVPGSSHVDAVRGKVIT